MPPHYPPSVPPIPLRYRPFTARKESAPPPAQQPPPNLRAPLPLRILVLHPLLIQPIPLLLPLATAPALLLVPARHPPLRIDGFLDSAFAPRRGPVALCRGLVLLLSLVSVCVAAGGGGERVRHFCSVC